MGFHPFVDLYRPSGRVGDYPTVRALSDVLFQFRPNLFIESLVQVIAQLVAESLYM